MHAKMLSRKSIFDDGSGATKKEFTVHANECKATHGMHISSMSKNLLDLSVTAENTNILA